MGQTRVMQAVKSVLRVGAKSSKKEEQEAAAYLKEVFQKAEKGFKPTNGAAA